MIRPDPIEILVRNQAAAHMNAGMPPGAALEQAETTVATILEELAQIGLADVYLSVALRRARVYRMRVQCMKVSAICERIGIGRTQVFKDIRAELERRRRLAS